MPSPNEHERAFELLPWLVNDTLATTERELIESHVRSCITCRRELKDQQRLVFALQTQSTIHISEQASFIRLADTLDERRPIREGTDSSLLRFCL